MSRPLAVLSRFRMDLRACLTARGDELFELADAVLCADGPVRTLAGLSLVLEPRALAQLARARARRKIAGLERALEGAEFFSGAHAAGRVDARPGTARRPGHC